MEANVAGVWNANPQEAGRNPEIPSYDKTTTFRRWLVSGLDEGSAADPDALKSDRFRNDEKGVILAGEKTTGQNDPKSISHLWAGRIPVARAKDKPSASGHTAYAVMDEGVKARLDIAAPPSSLSDERSRSAAGAPLRNAFDLIQQSTAGTQRPLDAYQPLRESTGKALTLASAPLLQTGLPDLAPYFHELTTDSAGVMADVTLGGLRKDLSTFGELATVPTEYLTRRIYSDSENSITKIPATANYNSGSPDPQWRLVHDQLNIRKRLGTFTGNNLPFVTFGGTAPSGFRGGSGTGDGFRINRDTQPVNPLAPVIVRCEVMFSFFAKETRGHSPWDADVAAAFGGGTEGVKWNHMLHLIYTPLVTLWNPYNVPLRLRQPVVEIANPPVALRFIRQSSLTPSAIGEVSNRLAPLDEMYLNDKFDKKFVMQLFGQVSSSGDTSGDVILLPGEVKLFSPAMNPSWNFQRVFDWQNNMTHGGGGAAMIKAAPGWRGPQYGFNIDYLVPNPNQDVISPRNGPVRAIGVVGSRIEDVWDVECGLSVPRRKNGSPVPRYAVSLMTSTGGTTGASPSNVLSRLEFDYDANMTVLTKALTPAGTAKIPFRMSEYSNPEVTSNISVAFNDPLVSWIVKPFMVMTAQAKTTTDSVFPSKAWVQNNSTRPLSYQSLASDHQAWNSHELALIRYQNGMATDAKVDGKNRAFAFGGATPLFGSSFCIHRELALTPVQSVAQLSHFDLAASAFPGSVDHAVGSSFANPLVNSGEFLTKVSNQPSSAVDHSWLANFRLWDSWYASTYVNQRTPSWPVQTELKKVISDFANGSKRLPNTRFSPWMEGRKSEDLESLLTKSAAEPQDDAFRKSAATQLLDGAFNINSTSKAAWMAVLGGLDRETIASLLFDGNQFSVQSNRLTPSQPYLTRKRMPAESSDTAAANGQRFGFWNGGCELTRPELEALAAGIVREVKRRGPFLSLSEFVNRRIGPESDLTLKGAIQAAIDDAPGIGDLNSNTTGPRKALFNELSRNLGEAETGGVPYAYPRAAHGQTALGASGGLDQLAVLTQIGGTISARSDTFRIRAYGDATDANGKITARAWCEAIVQRVPEYVVGASNDGNAPWDSPATATINPTNLAFGRSFRMKSFRWLAENEI